jgi:outer membrane protein assembly factor BamA
VGRIGVVEPFGDSDRTHIWDRFYLGGAYTLRGYKFRDVGPKDFLGEPTGGNSYWMGSLEYSVPIIERLRAAVFYDIGVVNNDAFDFDRAITMTTGDSDCASTSRRWDRSGWTTGFPSTMTTPSVAKPGFSSAWAGRAHYSPWILRS